MLETTLSEGKDRVGHNVPGGEFECLDRSRQFLTSGQPLKTSFCSQRHDYCNSALPLLRGFYENYSASLVLLQPRQVEASVCECQGRRHHSAFFVE